MAQLRSGQMVDIECLACDEPIKLPQFIDTDDYDGQLVCSKCKALLYVKFATGKLRKYKIVERSRPTKEELNIIVKDEETKQLLQRVGERTGKLAESKGSRYP